MEEHPTRQALDELADLFLTGLEGGPAASPSPATPSAKPLPPSATAPLTDKNDALDGPASIRLESSKTPPASAAPAAAANSPAPAAPSERPHLRLHRDDAATDAPPWGPYGDVLDAAVNAAIQRGQTARQQVSQRASQQVRESPAAPAVPAVAAASSAASTAPTASSAPVAPVVIEAVLLGNLPGLSGPWLTQYAQRLAQERGPVAVLHLEEDQIDAELVEPTDRPLSAGRVPPKGASGGLADRLEALAASAQAPLRTVLLHVEADAPPTELLPRLRCVQAWTLLCGADDAAVVGAYRLLKQWAQHDGFFADQRIKLQVMGSDQAAADQAADKLRQAAASFLRVPVELAGSQQQMMPVNLRQLGRYPHAEPLWARLEQWAQGSTPTPAPGSGSPHPRPRKEEEQPAPPEFPEPPEWAEAADQWEEEESLLSASVADSTGHVSGEAAASAGSAEGLAASSPSRAQPEALPEPAEPLVGSPTQGPDLAALLGAQVGELAGGIALEARCPHQPQTQLLLDSTGRLHLLRRQEPDEHGRHDLHGLRAAIVDLLQARQWAVEHLRLIQLTQRQCRFDPHAPPVLHVLTPRADLAAALAARLGCSLRFHLLQEVRVGDQRAWVCAPLNP